MCGRVRWHLSAAWVSLDSAVLLGHLFFIVQLGAGVAKSALAANDAGCGQEKQRRRHQQQYAEAGEDADHLRSVPDDRRPRVAQFVFAGAFVVVAE